MQIWFILVKYCKQYCSRHRCDGGVTYFDVTYFDVMLCNQTRRLIASSLTSLSLEHISSSHGLLINQCNNSFVNTLVLIG